MPIYKLPAATLLLLFSTGVFAQSGPGSSLSGADHFLWFTGRWNPMKKDVFEIRGIGDSTLTGWTPGSIAGGKGGTVTVEPDGSIKLRTGGTQAWNNWVDKALESEDKYIQDLQNPKDNLDPATLHLHQMLLPDAKERQQQLTGYKIDPQQDLLSGQKAASPKPARTPTPTNPGSSYCKSAKADYDAVMTYYTNHVKGHKNDLDVPSPPAFEYNCYACDSNLRKVYDTAVEHYARDFLHPEDSILAKGFNILHNLAQSNPCPDLSPGDLYQAVYGILYHLEQRGEKLVQTNRKNFKAAKAIIRTFLTITRNWALLTGSESAFETLTPDLESLITQNIDFYHDAFIKHDWRTVGNIPYLLSLYRDKELLGGNDQDFQQYLTQLLKTVNAFRLSVEMDIKIGKDNGYRIAHVKGDCHIIPSFRQDSNQCYKWVVADESQQDVLGFYKPNRLQSIDCQLIDNEMITPPNVPKVVYTGTRKYTALLQSLSMDFCNPGQDTIALTGFSPKPSSAGVWQFPYTGPQNLGVNGMEQFFEDVMAKKKLADDGEARKEASNIQQQGEQIKKEMAALKNQMGGNQGAVSYEKIQELMNKARSITTTTVAAKMLYLDFLLPVQNNNAVLVDKKFNAKEINPKESEVIVYGYYTIHIENNADGKTKPTQK